MVVGTELIIQNKTSDYIKIQEKPTEPLPSNEEENYSIILKDIAGTTVTGGKALETFVLANQASQLFDLEKYDIHLLPNDVLVVTAVIPSGGASSDCTASLSWLEDL